MWLHLRVVYHLVINHGVVDVLSGVTTRPGSVRRRRRGEVLPVSIIYQATAEGAVTCIDYVVEYANSLGSLLLTA